jgi:hypothetical protein
MYLQAYKTVNVKQAIQFEMGVIKQFKTLGNLRRIFFFLTWTEITIAIILFVYTNKNSHVLGETLSYILYSLAAFVILFAFAENLLLAVAKKKNKSGKNKSIQTVTLNSKEQMIDTLHNLIEKQKCSIFRKRYTKYILSILDKLVPSRHDAIRILEIYKTRYRKKLNGELEGLTSSYELKKEYMRKFIDFKLVEEEYPHRLIKISNDDWEIRRAKSISRNVSNPDYIFSVE